MAALLALAGCAHVPAPPRVAGGESVPAGMRRLSLALGETTIQPVLLAHPAAIYPPALAPLHLAAQAILVQLTVNGEGRVERVLIPEQATADRHRQAFIAAIRTAVAQWRYSPLIIQHLAADADGYSHGVDQRRPCFSQVYLFHFAWQAGAPISEATAITAARY